ncbi:hypothetical protein MHPYR_150056 [uncultured Mycobacterium sp.]|uniref:Uncharacterized protein n=1 Tax=uncultured Mycobacterium sp. TaxID=171292 RepID=A0A1Y5P5V1_9MYCO|nr:hypothetical protein MHPYR_150056 [uncultured Mycobacterium sp.]
MTAYSPTLFGVLARSESMNACPIRPTPGGSKRPRAKMTSASGQSAAVATAVGNSDAAMDIIAAAPLKTAVTRMSAIVAEVGGVLAANKTRGYSRPARNPAASAGAGPDS